MVRQFLIIAAFAASLFGQATRPPDTYEYIQHAGGTKPTGNCLVWTSTGRVTSATCGAGGGSTETASNVGTGVGLFRSKVTLDLQFKSLLAGSNKITITSGTNEVSIDADPANFLLSALGGTLNLAQIAQGGATTGQLLQWNGTNWAPASTGGGGGPANTDALAEGSTNLYYTAARARAALSVSGILSYDNGTGVFSCANCANITSTYSNPAWISALAWSKITGAPTFQLASEKGTANGYASLGAGGYVPVAQLGSGTANSTNFLRGDGTWTNPAGSVNLLLAGTSIGTRPGLNFISGTGVTIAAVDDAGNNRVNITASANTSVVLTKDTAKDGTPWYCRSTTGNDSYACTIDPAYTSTTLTRGQYVFLDPDIANTGAATISIGSGTVRNVYTNAGVAPANGVIPANRGTLLYWNGTDFSIVGDGGGSATGDVVGPASAVDSAVALFDTTTGKLLKGTASAGTAGQVLTSNGAGVSPSFQAASGGTAISGLFMPVQGQMDTATATPPITTGLNVFFYQFNVPAPGVTFSAYKGFATAAAQGNIAFAVYNSSCTLIAGTTGQQTSATSNAAFRAAPASPVTLAAGTYFLAFTSTVSTGAVYGLRGGYFAEVADVGELSTVSSGFFGDDATGSAPIVMPASCGTRTAANMTGTSVPFLILR